MGSRWHLFSQHRTGIVCCSMLVEILRVRSEYLWICSTSNEMIQWLTYLCKSKAQSWAMLSQWNVNLMMFHTICSCADWDVFFLMCPSVCVCLYEREWNRGSHNMGIYPPPPKLEDNALMYTETNTINNRDDSFHALIIRFIVKKIHKCLLEEDTSTWTSAKRWYKYTNVW